MLVAMTWTIRNKRCHAVLLMMLIGVLSAFGCTPPASAPDSAAPPDSQPAPKKGPVTAPATVSKIPGQDEWSKLVAAARIEGKVTIYGDPPVREGPFVETLLIKYGLRMEIVMGRATETAEKLQRERRAGIYLADAVIGGPDTLVNILKPLDVLDAGAIESSFMLPELMVPEEIQKTWWRGRLYWNDTAHTSLSFMATPGTMMAINTELVKPAIRSYRDLLDPKWKGKIVFQDPTAGGGGFRPVAIVGAVFLNWDFWREVMSKQEPVFTRDVRIQTEWLARGKFAIAYAPRTEMVTYFKENGAPIDFVIPAEGLFLNSGAGGIGLINKAAHPNATKLFVNYLLSQEGQTLFSQKAGLQSARIDVPTDHLHPAKVRQPGANYYVPEGENQVQVEAEWRKMVDEIVKPFLK